MNERVYLTATHEELLFKNKYAYDWQEFNFDYTILNITQM